MEVSVSSQYLQEHRFVLKRVEVEVEQNLLVAELVVGLHLFLVQFVNNQILIVPGAAVVVVYEYFGQQSYFRFAFFFAAFEHF